MDTCITDPLAPLTAEQNTRDAALLQSNPYCGPRFESKVLPFTLDLARGVLSAEDELTLAGLEKEAARTAIESLASLARNANDIDHLGGGLELIPALLMTLAATDYQATGYTIEHGHTSIGYYSALSALGFVDRGRVIDAFRRSLDIAGHVSWLPGGTELSSGRLGVMVPVGSGFALGLKAHHGAAAHVICHCGDAGWISGQALNGFNAAAVHRAPITFVMHRNGIQLSGTTRHIMNQDPRRIIESFGIRILEIRTLLDRQALFGAYQAAFANAQNGQPTLIYPTGYGSSPQDAAVTIADFGRMYGIADETREFAAKNDVSLDRSIWIPGSLMSYRDVIAMLQCVFYVNDLPGGEGHHDGGMKGRDAQAVLSSRLLQFTPEERARLDALASQPPRIVVTTARPSKGTPNLTLTAGELQAVALPDPGKAVSPRAGSEAAYVAVAKKYASRMFVVSADLNPSTKLAKAVALLPPPNHFEMSIEEQAATLLVDGLSYSSREPQLNVFSTFAAFMEGIAREGFEMWRYQRNLTGYNEGLNVLMHLAHVGACTGRDHFSGWSLDWINLGLGYLPFLRRFHAPADARSAFLAVVDAAAGWGGHIVAIPRDTLPILTKEDGRTPLWNATDAWTSVTPYRQRQGAATAILAIGAPSYLAGEASDRAAARGVASDVFVINGFPVDEPFFDSLAKKYDRVITIEDGLIGTVEAGLRGFAAFVSGKLAECGMKLEHLGIADPRIAPSETFEIVWAHWGMTADALTERLLAS
ncbi:MAG TPA: thiamine pyrophosphate-dependent enzyme [Vicinamibacterales bacterium]|jgi:transketolase N-terminal domain/subunit/transketolase C-terminal domain/subunit